MESYITLIILSAVGGVVGAIVMNAFMYLVSAQSEARVNMIEALGSLITKKTEGAIRVGSIFHIISGVVFGIIYGLILSKANALALPYSIFLGLGMGLFHGIVVAYCLMFIVSEKHPIEKYRNATFLTGAIHLLGHIIFGGVVGLVIGTLIGVM